MTDQTRAWGAGLAERQSGWFGNREPSDKSEPADASSPSQDSNAEQATSVAGDPASPLLHASNGFPIRLNKRWRVSFHELQWILERHRGGRWLGSAFCVTRQALLRNIHERCGEVDPDALDEVKNLPAWHPDRTRGAP